MKSAIMLYLFQRRSIVNLANCSGIKHHKARKTRSFSRALILNLMCIETLSLLTTLDLHALVM